MKIIHILYKTFLFIFLSVFIVIMGLYTYAYFSEPIKLNAMGTYYLYDNKDNLVYQGNSISKWASLDEISNNLVNAVIAVEDKNFYEHNGFDYFRIAKAMIKNISNGKIVEGASTISQQYIKNAYLEFDQTWQRKIHEALLTLNLEVHYKKDDILEAYLNTINYGNGNFGISNASEYYFNKKPSELSLEEALILAGVPKNPGHYNPVSNYEKAIQRAKIVGFAMYENNYIDKDTYENLFQKEIPIYGKKKNNNLQMLMYYQDAVINELKNLDEIDNTLINSGNLKVYTTLDFNAQKILEEEILAEGIPDVEVASVIVDPNNGGVLALTGGMNYAKSQYNRALLSKRQVGSTMKPFLYYSALENGMTGASTFKSQYTTFSLSDGKEYSPKNWSNIYGNKEITMATAIAYSDNIYAVKTNLFLGYEKMIDTAHKCGIETELSPVASLALGTSEINILDFASGYTTFASGGYKRNLHFINKVEDENGNVLYEYQNQNNLVLNPNYTFILNELLTSTTNAAFKDYATPTGLGIASKLSTKYALKTGTTDYDFWSVGYNKNILMMIWTGHDDNSPLALSAGNKTSHIWANVIEKIDYNKENSWYDMPANVVGIPLNAINGEPTNDPNKATMFYFLKGSEPIIEASAFKKEE